MKIREGFVSNSSTTSFTCDACGEVIAYHDSIGYEDIGVVEFKPCGHGLCCNHPDFDEEGVQEKWTAGVVQSLNEEIEYLDKLEGSRWESKEDIQKRSDQMKEALTKSDDFDEFKRAVSSLGYGWRNYLPSTLCPVCSLQELNYDHIMSYVVAKHKLNLSEVHDEIKERFGSFDKFSEWLKEQEKTDENS